MFLATMIMDTDDTANNLSGNERLVLQAIIKRINSNKLETDGYYSYPATDYISRKTSLSESTVKRARKSLQDAGWISIKSGLRDGDSNKYTVNAEKIIDAYVASGFKRPDKPLAKPLDGIKTTKKVLKHIEPEEVEDDDYPY